VRIVHTFVNVLANEPVAAETALAGTFTRAFVVRTQRVAMTAAIALETFVDICTNRPGVGKYFEESRLAVAFVGALCVVTSSMCRTGMRTKSTFVRVLADAGRSQAVSRFAQTAKRADSVDTGSLVTLAVMCVGNAFVDFNTASDVLFIAFEPWPTLTFVKPNRILTNCGYFITSAVVILTFIDIVACTAIAAESIIAATRVRANRVGTSGLVRTLMRSYLTFVNVSTASLTVKTDLPYPASIADTHVTADIIATFGRS
jgi:hypothetical protein